MSAPQSTEPVIFRKSLHLRGFEPERLEEIICGGRFEHFILSRSACEVLHERWECGGFSVDAARYSFAVRACGVFAPDRVCIGYTRGGDDPTWINGFACGLEAIQYYPPGCEINYRASAGGAWVAIEFDEASLQRMALTRLGRELELPHGRASNLMVPRAGRRTLEHIVDRSLRQTTRTHSLADPILGCVVELLDQACNGRLESHSRRWRHREELLAKAERFLRSNLGQPFDGKSLAAAVGATERTIQKHFMEAYGTTPGQWARCLSLHHARRRLLETDPARFTVEGIARETGFRHMGRFARNYQDLFGEYPSETLLRLPT